MAIDPQLSPADAEVKNEQAVQANFVRLGYVIGQLELASRQPRLMIVDHFDSVVNEIDVDTEMIIERLETDQDSQIKIAHLNETREKMISSLKEGKMDALELHKAADRLSQPVVAYDIQGLQKTFEKLSAYIRTNERLSGDNSALNEPILQLLAVIEPKLIAFKRNLLSNRTVLLLRNGREFESKFDLHPEKHSDKTSPRS